MGGNADARGGAAVEGDPPGATKETHHHVGDHVALVGRGGFLHRGRVEGQDQSDRPVDRRRLDSERAGQRRMVVGGEGIDVGGQDARGELAVGAGRLLEQLRRQAFGGAGGGHAGPVAVQQALADGFEFGRCDRKRFAALGGEGPGGLFEEAAVVAVVEPPLRQAQVVFVPLEGELLQQPHAVVAGTGFGDAGAGVVVGATETAAGEERRFGQLVPRLHFQLRGVGVGVGIGLADLVRLVGFQHGVTVQRLAQLLFQLRRGQLQESDRLQQLRRQIDALRELRPDAVLHVHLPFRLVGGPGMNPAGASTGNESGCSLVLQGPS